MTIRYAECSNFECHRKAVYDGKCDKCWSSDTHTTKQEVRLYSRKRDREQREEEERELEMD